MSAGISVHVTNDASVGAHRIVLHEAFDAISKLPQDAGSFLRAVTREGIVGLENAEFQHLIRPPNWQQLILSPLRFPWPG